MKTIAGWVFGALLAGGCATTSTSRPVAPRVAVRGPIRGGEFHIHGTPSGSGDAYDATALLARGNDRMRANQCAEAEDIFARLEREFAGSTAVSAARYNRGVCLQQLDRLSEAAEEFREASTSSADASLVRDARFRLAAVGERAAQWDWSIEATSAVLASQNLSVSDRVEANGRRAVALLALGRRDDAAHHANVAVAEAPDEESLRRIGDDTWVARSRYVLAELTRIEASEIVVRAEAPDMEQQITRRVLRTVHAHAQFNETIRVGNPEWAAAAGYRIGEMYQELYRSIVDAPLPAQWEEPARALYRRRTGERLRPLLTGALRSWEATLSMARRNGISDNEWVHRASDAVAELRRWVLEPS